MTAPRAPIPANPAEHPLHASLARGDRALSLSAPALQHLLAAQDRALTDEAIVAQVGGMLSDLARQCVAVTELGIDRSAQEEQLRDRLLLSVELRDHCHVLALEWRLARLLEHDRALDPVLAPALAAMMRDGDESQSSLAMAVLAAQARFAQEQRRMELPLNELPAELFHLVLEIASDVVAGWTDATDADLRRGYDEGAGRLALIAKLVGQTESVPADLLMIENAGMALWSSALALAARLDRQQIIRSAASMELGRLLLTLRAAGVSPSEAERQALCLHPDALLPTGLQDIGIREAAQWLADAQ